MIKISDDQIRQFQREYLGTWFVGPCEQCDGFGKVILIEKNKHILCSKCKGRKIV